MRTFFTSVALSALFIGSMPAKAQPEEKEQPADCVVMLKNGRKMTVQRFWRINDHTVEYESSGNLHDLIRDDIDWIRCDGRQFKLVGDRLEPWNMPVSTTALNAIGDDLLPLEPATAAETSAIALSTKELFDLGQEDARKYHGRTALGLATGFVAAPTIIAAPIIAAIPPFVNKNNPNLDVYLKEREYRRGYRSIAHPKKAGTVILGMVIGVVGILTVTHSY